MEKHASDVRGGTLKVVWVRPKQEGAKSQVASGRGGVLGERDVRGVSSWKKVKLRWPAVWPAWGAYIGEAGKTGVNPAGKLK